MSLEELKYFFSYARNDSEFVLKLAKELRAVGANLWLDQLDILGGQHWDSTVEKALKSCKGMIAVLSPESVASDNVMDEVSYALNEGKLVVPVLIRPCNIPYRLQRVQYIDFTADYDTGFTQLLRALGIEQPLQPVETASTQEPVIPEPSLPKRSESTIGEQKPAEVRTKRQKTKVIAAICIVMLIAIVSIVIFRKYLKTYSLTATADPNGSVEKSPDKTSYEHGETVTLKAVPNTGYSFENWSGNLSGSTNPATLVMDDEKSVTASFVLKTYSLSATAVDGSVEKSPDKISYKHGETVKLEAVPNEGYVFSNWSGALSDSNNPVELVIMDADKSVTASFAPKTYGLTTPTVDGGSVTKSPDKTSYKHGQKVTLEAVPNKGYRFTKWSGDLSGSTNPATIKIDSKKSITASFAHKTYSLTATADPNGSVTKDPNQASYKHGETVILEAVPNMGYFFTKWSGDLDDSANPATLEMCADKSVKANFVLKTYSLDTPPPADGGSVTKSPDKTSYKHGETVTLEAVPNPGYGFKNWSGDLSGRTNPATLVMDGDKGVTASFSFVLKVVTNSIGMRLIYIPAGSFVMGSSDSAAQLSRKYYRKEEDFADEFPQHQVRISKGFWMGQTEVTQGQYKSVMKESPWSVAKSFQKVLDPAVDVIKSIPSLLSGAKSFQKDPDCPAGFVSWYKAVEFCRKLSEKEGKTYRLPNEAEWEYACRAGTTTRFSFGDSDSSLDDYAWYRSNAHEVGQKYAHQVGLKKPNPWGLYDLHGNVWEWCSDFYDKDYYSNSPSVDPKGPPAGSVRSLRGGSWLDLGSGLRCSSRHASDPDTRVLLIGFRVVRSQ